MINGKKSKLLQIEKADGALFAAALVVLLAAGVSFFLKDGKSLLQKKTELSFYTWWDAKLDGAALSALIKNFEAENPLLTVRVVHADWEETRDYLLNAGNASAGNSQKSQKSDGKTAVYKGPDLISMDSSWTDELVDAALLEPLPDFFAGENTEQADDGEDAQAFETVENRPPASDYFVPLVSFVHPLFYNTAILSEAGYSRPPHSREEFLDYAKKTTNAEKGVFGAAISRNVWTDLLSWVWAGGAQPVNAAKIDFSSRQIKDTFSFIYELNNEKLLYPSPLARREEELLSAFVDGKIAMLVLPSQSISEITAKKADFSFSVTTIPQPGKSLGKPVFSRTDWTLGIPAMSGRKEAALLFLKYLLTHKEELAVAAHGFTADEAGLSVLVSGNGESAATEQKLNALVESSNIVSVQQFSSHPGKDLPALRAAVLELWLKGELSEIELEG